MNSELELKMPNSRNLTVIADMNKILIKINSKIEMDVEDFSKAQLLNAVSLSFWWGNIYDNNIA